MKFKLKEECRGTSAKRMTTPTNCNTLCGIKAEKHETLKLRMTRLLKELKMTL